MLDYIMVNFKHEYSWIVKTPDFYFQKWACYDMPSIEEKTVKFKCNHGNTLVW